LNSNPFILRNFAELKNPKQTKIKGERYIMISAMMLLEMENYLANVYNMHVS